MEYPPESADTAAGAPPPAARAAGPGPEEAASSPTEEGAQAPSPGRISRPLALLMLAAMVVGLLAALGQYEAWGPPAGPEPARPARQDGLILAGNRVDFITLNLPIEQVEAVLGTGKIRPAKDSQLYIFDEAGLSVGVQQGLVQHILVKNPNLHTPDGLAVSSDVDRVVRSFGPDYEQEVRTPQDYSLHYWAKGIHFAVEGTRVVSILVAQPTHGPDAFPPP